MSSTAAKSFNKQWQARLELDFYAGPMRTYVKRRHYGPLRIQRPFYPPDRTCHVYLLHPPGGVVGGDQLDVVVNTHPGAKSLVTTPGAAKFYRSASQTARARQTLSVASGSLEWLPQENIFFDGCRAHVDTTIQLDQNAAFSGWDIQCLGRPAGDNPFLHGSMTNRLSVFIDSAPLLLDRLVIDEQYTCAQLTGLRGATVCGLFLMYKLPASALEITRPLLLPANEFSATSVDSLLVVRYLGHSAETARRGFTAVWSALRPLVHGSDACAPRIWST